MDHVTFPANSFNSSMLSFALSNFLLSKLLVSFVMSYGEPESVGREYNFFKSFLSVYLSLFFNTRIIA